MSFSSSEIAIKLNKLCNSKEFNKYDSLELKDIELYFFQQLAAEDCRIRKLEQRFFISLENYIKAESLKSNSFFSFLRKHNHKINFETAKRIHTLYKARIFIIEKEFEDDIWRIKWFVDLSKSNFKKSELFIFSQTLKTPFGIKNLLLNPHLIIYVI